MLMCALTHEVPARQQLSYLGCSGAPIDLLLGEGLLELSPVSRAALQLRQQAVLPVSGRALLGVQCCNLRSTPLRPGLSPGLHSTAHPVLQAGYRSTC